MKPSLVLCTIALLGLMCTPLLVSAQADDTTEAFEREQAEAEAAQRRQAESEAQAAVDSEIEEAEAAAAAEAEQEAHTEATPAAEQPEATPTEPEPADNREAEEAAAREEAAQAAARRQEQEAAAEKDFKKKAAAQAQAKRLAEEKAALDAQRAQHKAVSGSQAMEDIAQDTQLALDGEEPTWLDFGDILLQKALGAAEAAGMSAQHREHMMSDAQGISASKRRIMSTNHSAHETCKYDCSAPGTVPVADSLHNASVFADGCGAPGLKVNQDFPFSKCCHSHDVCYSTCNTNKNRCDLDFIFCMNSTCNYVAPNDQCRHAAVGLFDDTVGESEGACGSYVSAQGKACNCVASKVDL